MTVTYTGRVANARLCAFSCLLFHWKGSIYKLMYKEMIIFCSLYATISTIYRLALDVEQKRTFEKIALYCETFINLIPLSFVLGFYIAIVVTRWWNQYTSIPWPDRVMVYVTTMIEGNDEQGRLIRRTLMRYLALGSLIVFQATSVRVKKRFPTFDHLIEAGVASRAEIQALDDVSTPHGKWWIPFVWCCNLVKEARKQGRIADNYLLKSLIDEISAYRGNLGMLYSYDWISVPLVYTQVTTLAVYTFFLGCVFGRQYLDPEQNYPGHNIDLYIPFFTLLQFFFYMGWLKVAEQLINPFGEDDDDFEMNWIIDRNMQVSLLTTDDLYGQIPPIEKDLYYGEPPPDYLPYTKSSIKAMSQPHMGSTIDIRVSDEGMKVLSPLETIQEGVAVGNTAYASSYLNTPRRNTPLASPYLGHCHNQNFMSGMLTPAEIRSRTSLHSGEKDMEEVSLPGIGTGHSIISRATEKLGKWLTDHSSRTDLNRSFHSTFVGIVSRQTSANDEIDHNPDPLAMHSKDGQMIDCKIGSLPSTNGGKLSPVAEVYSSKLQMDNGGALIELNEQVAKELESEEITCTMGQYNEVMHNSDTDISLISTGEPCPEESARLNEYEMPKSNQHGGNCDFDLNSAVRTELSGFGSVQMALDPEEQRDGLTNNISDKPKNRVIVIQIPEGSLTWDPSTMLNTIERQETSSSKSSLPQIKLGDGRLANGETLPGHAPGPAEGVASFQEFPSLGWMPHSATTSNLEHLSVGLSAHLRDRHCSDSSDEYEMPESNQCSVTSMTPLLTSDASKNYLHEFNASTVDKAAVSGQVQVTSAL